MKIITASPIDDSDFIADVATYMGDVSLHVFAMGFLEMAEISAERAVKNRCSIDAVIPATLYSLRHSVELFLKYVLYDLRVVDEKYPIPGHDVKAIFAKHKEVLAIALGCEPENGFHWRDWAGRFESLLESVHELDPDGQSVRYPSARHLVPNQGGGYSISTKHLASCISGVRTIFQEYEERNC